MNVTYKTLSNEAMVPDYVTDTAARRIDFEYTNNRLTGIKQMRGNTAFYYLRIDYNPVAIQVRLAIPPVLDEDNNVITPGVPVQFNRIPSAVGREINF